MGVHRIKFFVKSPFMIYKIFEFATNITIKNFKIISQINFNFSLIRCWKLITFYIQMSNLFKFLVNKN